jgi:hypothetical protein
VILVAVAAVVAIILATQSSPSAGASGQSNQPPGSTTVQRRNLVATDTESGSLSYADPQTVYDRLTGTITWLPAVGQVIHQGEPLFKVDGQPVTLLNGTTPAYRDLDAADTPGPDILELNRDLVALGFTSEGIIVDDVWQPATSAAVEVFQESLGESPTGELALGQVVFLPGNQVVSTVDATLGGDGGSGGAGAASGSSSAAVYRGGGSAAEFVSLTTPGKAKPRRRHPASWRNPHTIAGLLALLRAESAELRAENAQLQAELRSAGKSGGSNRGSGSSNHGGSRAGGGRSGSSGGAGGSSGGGGGSSGGGGGNATAVLQTSSTQLVATVDLDASKQSEAKVGEKVTVVMPAGNTVNGTVTAVSPVAQSSSNSGNNNNGGGGGSGGGSGNGNGSSGATVPVTIALSGHQRAAGLDQAAVSVNFVQSEAKDVLSVPVTALLAISGGGYAVQQARAPHHLIPVTTGLFAAGYVQISGPGVYSGLQVTDSQG